MISPAVLQAPDPNAPEELDPFRRALRMLVHRPRGEMASSAVDPNVRWIAVTME